MSIKYSGSNAISQVFTLVKNALSQKADTPLLTSTDSGSELTVQDNSITEYTALAAALTVTLPTDSMTYGALLRVTIASGGSIAGFMGVSFVDGDDFSSAAEGDTWEFSVYNGSVICKLLTAVA